MFKNECPDDYIYECVALASKMYSLVTTSGQAKTTAKGVSNAVRRKLLKHDEYKNALFSGKQRKDVMTRIGHESHQLYTLDVMKTSLNPYNDKIYIERDENDFKTHSFGHFSLRK